MLFILWKHYPTPHPYCLFLSQLFFQPQLQNQCSWEASLDCLQLNLAAYKFFVDGIFLYVIHHNLQCYIWKCMHYSSSKENKPCSQSAWGSNPSSATFRLYDLGLLLHFFVSQIFRSKMELNVVMTSGVL